MENCYIAFIDETGTFTKDPQQPYFGLGIIYLKDTSAIYNDLVLIKDQITSYFHNRDPFKEFKFAIVNDLNLIFYKKLLDIYKTYAVNKQLGFQCLIVDKHNISSDWNITSTNTYEAYVTYSKQLINSLQIHSDYNGICLLVDHFYRPKDTRIFYESSLKNDEKILQCCMLESHSSLFIQLVDVLLGCVIYKKKYIHEGKMHTSSKLKLATYLENIMGVDDITKIEELKKLNFRIIDKP